MPACPYIPGTVCWALWRSAEPLTSTEIARALGLQPGQAHEALQHWVQAGLVLCACAPDSLDALYALAEDAAWLALATGPTLSPEPAQRATPGDKANA